MRYRFIVFGAQPKQESIAFSVYLEEAVCASGGGPAAATPRISPSDEYTLAAQFTSPFAVPAGCVPVSHPEPAAPSRVCRTIERTWGQCEWLQERIETGFRLQALPPFPEQPSAKKTPSPLYVERYRARIERWLNRLGAREDICRSASMDTFISPGMSDTDLGSSSRSKQSLSSMLLNLFGGSAGQVDHGFTVFVPTGGIDEFDEDEEEQRREYITATEERAGELEAAVKAMHAQEEVVGKSMVKVAQAVTKAFRPDAISLDPVPRQSDASCPSSDSQQGQGADIGSSVDHQRLAVSIAMLENSAEAHYWETKELATWREYNVIDVVMEYQTMAGGMKQIMNHAMRMLMLYEKAMLQYQAHERRANDLRVHYPSGTSSVKYANEQEAESGREMDLAHQEYTDAKDVATTELVRFERERAHGIRKALENMASVELDAARARREELLQLRRRIRNIQMVKDPPHSRTNIGPMLWQSADSSHGFYPPMPPTPRASASGTSPFASAPSSSTAYSRRPAHAHSASSGSAKMAGIRSASNRSGGPVLRRVQTVDGMGSRARSNELQLARNHSVFAGVDSDDDDMGEPSCSSAPVASTSAGPSKAPAASTSGVSLRQKKRWNGRISTLPFQGYDPKASPEHRIVDQSRLEEMAAEAEMAAELARSGLLPVQKTPRSRHASASTMPATAATLQPPVLPAFRSKTTQPSLSAGKLRATNSCNSLSTIPQQPVSPSEYLQYSRQTLHSSLSRVSSSSPGTSRQPSTSRPHLPASPASRGKDIKGKGRAFAV
ncbi:hypothetical protein GGF46_001617 [Coemansia sp. RSA 552]|nr:hypothetical protein GGF46_001617 [Coemansia sp. RSA 552]